MKTLLQTIIDLLEEGGVRVLGADTYPPGEGEGEDEKETSVTLRVLPGNADDDSDIIEDCIADNFFKDCINYKKNAFETFDNVYKNYHFFVIRQTFFDPRAMSKTRFNRYVKKHYPQIKFVYRKYVDSDVFDTLCLLNLQLKETPEITKGVKEGNFHCTDGNCSACEDSSTCPASPENMEVHEGGDTLTLKPEAAIKKMMSGEILRSRIGLKAYYKNGDKGFVLEDNKGNHWFITDFTNLYTEADYAQVYDKS